MINRIKVFTAIKAIIASSTMASLATTNSVINVNKTITVNRTAPAAIKQLTENKTIMHICTMRERGMSDNSQRNNRSAEREWRGNCHQ